MGIHHSAGLPSLTPVIMTKRNCSGKKKRTNLIRLATPGSKFTNCREVKEIAWSDEAHPQSKAKRELVHPWPVHHSLSPCLQTGTPSPWSSGAHNGKFIPLQLVQSSPSLTDIPIDQPKLDNSSLRLFSQLFLQCAMLALGTNHPNYLLFYQQEANSFHK